MMPLYCDFEALEDLSDSWHGQQQSTQAEKDNLAALSMCRQTVQNIERMMDLTDRQPIDLYRSPIMWENWYDDCEYERKGRSRAGYYDRYDCSDFDFYTRDRRGRYINGERRYATYTEPQEIKIPQITLVENQILRDGFLIQQYPYPDITLELVIAYVGGEEKPKITESNHCEYQPHDAITIEEAKSWLERFLEFLLSLVKRRS